MAQKNIVNFTYALLKRIIIIIFSRDYFFLPQLVMYDVRLLVLPKSSFMSSHIFYHEFIRHFPQRYRCFQDVFCCHISYVCHQICSILCCITLRENFFICHFPCSVLGVQNVPLKEYLHNITYNPWNASVCMDVCTLCQPKSCGLTWCMS